VVRLAARCPLHHGAWALLTAVSSALSASLPDRLQRLAPHIPIVSEENAAVGYDVRRSYQYSWCVDPLDGTKVCASSRLCCLVPPRVSFSRSAVQEFIKRNGQFTVNIALLRGGVPVLGVVHTPVTVRPQPLLLTRAIH
jgi:3'(2'), 5'-bisphosphate nucleotidase